MVDYVGYEIPNDANFEHRSNIKPEPASPDTIREIVREQQAHEERLKANELRQMAERAEQRAKRAELDRAQDQVRFASQRLMAKLWAVPCKDWDDDQMDLYSRIANWLEERP